MNVRIYHTAGEIGKAAATVVSSQIIVNPRSVLGLATGASPIPTYRELIRNMACKTSPVLIWMST